MKTTFLAIAFLFTGLLFSQKTIEKNIGEFTEVKAFDLINVVMIKSDENKVIIEGENQKNVKVVNRNGKLKIRMELEESYDGNDTDVTIYYTDVEIIDANEGAVIEVKDVLKQFDIQFKAQEGGDIKANIDVSYADVRSVTGGDIKLTGTSKNLEVSIYTGGDFNGKDLKTENTDVSINAGGGAHVNASKFVEARVRAGGDIYVYGNPKEIDQKTVLGGKVKRM